MSEKDEEELFIPVGYSSEDLPLLRSIEEGYFDGVSRDLLVPGTDLENLISLMKDGLISLDFDLPLWRPLSEPRPPPPAPFDRSRYVIDSTNLNGDPVTIRRDFNELMSTDFLKDIMRDNVDFEEKYEQHEITDLDCQQIVKRYLESNFKIDMRHMNKCLFHNLSKSTPYYYVDRLNMYFYDYHNNPSHLVTGFVLHPITSSVLKTNLAPGHKKITVDDNDSLLSSLSNKKTVTRDLFREYEKNNNYIVIKDVIFSPNKPSYLISTKHNSDRTYYYFNTFFGIYMEKASLFFIPLFSEPHLNRFSFAHSIHFEDTEPPVTFTAFTETFVKKILGVDFYSEFFKEHVSSSLFTELVTNKYLFIIFYHLKYILCRNNNEIFQYFLRSLAFYVQKPGVPLEKIILFYSIEQGSGKSLFFTHFLNNIIGKQHGLIATDSTIFNESFNSIISDKMLIFFDEFRLNTQSQNNCLKAFITGSDLTIHKKYHEDYNMKNHLSFIGVSNEHVSIPYESNQNRRVFLIESNGAYANSDHKDYFTFLAHALTDFKTMDLFFCLLHSIDLKHFNHKICPFTEELFLAIQVNLSPFELWLKDAMMSEHFYKLDCYNSYSNCSIMDMDPDNPSWRIYNVTFSDLLSSYDLYKAECGNMSNDSSHKKRKREIPNKVEITDVNSLFNAFKGLFKDLIQEAPASNAPVMVSNALLSAPIPTPTPKPKGRPPKNPSPPSLKSFNARSKFNFPDFKHFKKIIFNKFFALDNYIPKVHYKLPSYYKEPGVFHNFVSYHQTFSE